MKDYESLHRFAFDRIPVLKLELVDTSGAPYDKVVPLCSTSDPIKEAQNYLCGLPDMWFDRITSAKVAYCDLLHGYYSDSGGFESLDEDEINKGFFAELMHKARRERHLRKVADALIGTHRVFLTATIDTPHYGASYQSNLTTEGWKPNNWEQLVQYGIQKPTQWIDSDHSRNVLDDFLGIYEGEILRLANREDLQLLTTSYDVGEKVIFHREINGLPCVVRINWEIRN